MGDMIFIDWETTGLLKPEATNPELQPYGIEFYGIRIDEHWQMVSELETFLQPPIAIPEFIEKLTGITNEDVKAAPKFIDLYPDFLHFFMGAEKLIAHNCSFDRDILRWELTRLDLQFKFPWPPIQICTVESSFCIKNKRLTISKLHEMATGEPHEDGAHRARHDVMALIRNYKWLEEKGLV